VVRTRVECGRRRRGTPGRAGFRSVGVKLKTIVRRYKPSRMRPVGPRASRARAVETAPPLGRNGDKAAAISVRSCSEMAQR